jgi:hypothetical protein
LAKQVGLTSGCVSDVLRRCELKPHLSRTYKVSRDPDFVAKVKDVVGLYLAPPEHAVVLSVDEKTSIQAPRQRRGLRSRNPRHPRSELSPHPEFGASRLATADADRETPRRRRPATNSSRWSAPSGSTSTAAATCPGGRRFRSRRTMATHGPWKNGGSESQALATHLPASEHDWQAAPA